MGLDYQERFVRDPQICGGEPVIKGTRKAEEAEGVRSCFLPIGQCG